MVIPHDTAKIAKEKDIVSKSYAIESDLVRQGVQEW